MFTPKTHFIYPGHGIVQAIDWTYLNYGSSKYQQDALKIKKVKGHHLHIAGYESQLYDNNFVENVRIFDLCAWNELQFQMPEITKVMGVPFYSLTTIPIAISDHSTYFYSTPGRILRKSGVSLHVSTLYLTGTQSGIATNKWLDILAINELTKIEPVIMVASYEILPKIGVTVLSIWGVYETIQEGQEVHDLFELAFAGHEHKLYFFLGNLMF